MPTTVSQEEIAISFLDHLHGYAEECVRVIVEPKLTGTKKRAGSGTTSGLLGQAPRLSMSVNDVYIKSM